MFYFIMSGLNRGGGDYCSTRGRCYSHKSPSMPECLINAPNRRRLCSGLASHACEGTLLSHHCCIWHLLERILSSHVVSWPRAVPLLPFPSITSYPTNSRSASCKRYQIVNGLPGARDPVFSQSQIPLFQFYSSA